MFIARWDRIGNRLVFFKVSNETGCRMRVETLGNFKGKSRLPKQNLGTLDKLPREKLNIQVI